MNTVKQNKKRVQVMLDQSTIEALHRISEINGYESISRTIRIMVKKYEPSELNTTNGTNQS